MVLAPAISAPSLSSVFSTSIAGHAESQAGRFQISSVFRQEGLDRIDATVVGTSNAEIAKLLRDDTGDYRTAEPVPGE